MIDTSKYEGHTHGPWMWFRDDGNVDLVAAHSNNQCHTVLQEVKALYSEANENLIADAPLLLQEVKRLYRMVDGLQMDFDHDVHIWFHDEGWCEYLSHPCAICNLIDIDTVRKVFEAQWRMQNDIYENGMDMSDFSDEEQIAWVTEILNGGEEE